MYYEAYFHVSVSFGCCQILDPPPSLGNDKHLLSVDAHTDLVCLHRKVWMGNGIPFPHSGSLSSRLFLFTILAGAAWPPVWGPPGRAAAAGSAQVTSELRSRHDWVRPA